MLNRMIVVKTYPGLESLANHSLVYDNTVETAAHVLFRVISRYDTVRKESLTWTEKLNVVSLI